MADAPVGRLVTAILLGGLVAGTVDIGAASLIFHASPTQVLPAIASGLVGKAAAQGGNEILALGLILQWAMSIVIAAIYDLAALRLPTLARRWPPWGLAYGVGVYIVMTYVVVPLSRAPKHPHSPALSPHALLLMGENLAAMLLFGLIIAFFARKLAPA
jgi:uncharacterized membrane protein YagU involved in acid resistance